MGIGYMSAWGNGPSGSASVSGGGSSQGLALGGTVAPGLALAGVIRLADTSASSFHGGPAGQAPNSNADAALVQLGVLGDFYPDPEGGWHVGALLGLGGTVVTPRATDASMNSGGFTGSIFGGYDWWIGKSWSLGLQAVASGVTSATMFDTNHNDTGYRLQALAAGFDGSLLFY
jgi:hypothetical protein